MRVHNNTFVFIVLVALAVACGKRDDGSSSSEADTNETGGVTESINADASVPQEVAVGKGSTLSGTNVEFGPGSLTLSTDITVEEGTSLATPYVSEELGLSKDEALTSEGPATVITAAQAQDSLTPFSISIVAADTAFELRPDLNLAAEDTELMVLYKIKNVADDQLLIGLIPNADLVLGKGIITFEYQHFGVFQAVKAPKGFTAKSVVTDIPITTKANPPSIAFASASASVTEGDGPVKVKVSLSREREDIVAVSYTLSGTATDADHELVNGTFILEATATTQSLEFHITDDSEKESDETLILKLSTAQNAQLGTQVTHTLTIKDND